jgi:preprotein translocase subunit SecA
VLVGTISIEKSEHLASLLKREGIKHVVLNAKYHEREAEIVALAGRFGTVTIATNMAGRGTDIILGGVPDHRVKALLQQQEIDPEAASAEQLEAATHTAQEEMAADYKKALQERRAKPEQRRELVRSYLGLLAAFAPDHPSIVAVESLTSQVPKLTEYVEAIRVLSRKVKERISRDFYPSGEKPVDFHAVHPLKPAIDEIIEGDAAGALERFLQRNERETVVALGGVHILATERHEARRIDNQLRGRAGRQGDPGSSRFYLSLQDDLMRIFGSDRISGLMLKLGMEEGVPIEHKMVTKSIARAQTQVEAQNFSIRKHLLEYDDVMNKQREAIYGMRRMILEGKDTRDYVQNLGGEVLGWFLDSYCDSKQDPEEWNFEGLRIAVGETFGLEDAEQELQNQGRDELAATLRKRIDSRYEEKERQIGPEVMRFHERMIMLQIVDGQWKDHLHALDHLKEGIGLRGYGQRDPLVEYKKESYQMFQALMNRIDEEILKWIYLYQPVPVSEPEPGSLGATGRRAGSGRGEAQPGGPLGGSQARGSLPRNLSFNDPTEARGVFARAEAKEAKGGGDTVTTVRRDGRKVGRNEPCPCGSGKKYKKCHGA